jgi:hypothetical protein
MNDSQEFENQPTITFGEFKAWMAGLVLGKGGAIPDVNDWKMIKKMMDKVVEVQPIEPFEWPTNPYPVTDPFQWPSSAPIWERDSTGAPINPQYTDWTITCGAALDANIKSMTGSSVVLTNHDNFSHTVSTNIQEK